MNTRHVAVNGTAPSPAAARTDAADTAAVAPQRTTQATAVAAPETLVVAEPPPSAGLPALSHRPGTNLRLSEIDPDESEHYTEQKGCRGRAGAPARAHPRPAGAAVRRAQAQPADRAAGDGHRRQGRHHPRRLPRASTRRAARSGRSRRPAPRSWSTTSCGATTPKRRRAGMITIFNRSHYEDVLIVRVKKLMPEDVWRQRYAHDQRVRAHADAQQHDGPQVLPAYLQGRAEAPPRRAGSMTRPSTGSSPAPT